MEVSWNGGAMASPYFIKPSLTQTMRHAQQKRRFGRGKLWLQEIGRKMWDSLVNSVGQVCNQQQMVPWKVEICFKKKNDPTNPISAEFFSFRPPRFGGQKFRETWKRKGVELLVVLEGCGW